jgi:tetratricopeptide (TPR) repeat protein
LLHNHAVIEMKLGRSAAAEIGLRQALAILGESAGSRDHIRAACLNSLGVLYHETRRYAEAEPLFRQAIAIVSGPQAAPSAHIAVNLACTLAARQRWDEAEELFRRALAARTRDLGIDHPDTAAAMLHYAAMLRAQNRKSEAQPLEKRARAAMAKHAKDNLLIHTVDASTVARPKSSFRAN